MTEFVLEAERPQVLAGTAPAARVRWHRFLQHRAAVASAIILLLLGLAAIMAPWIEDWLGVNATRLSLINRFAPPSAEHLLGTDEIGRDLLARLLEAARVSLGVGLATAAIVMVIGTILGMIAGYYGGWLDGFLMRFTDAVIALPLLPLLIILAAVDMRKLPIIGDYAGSDLASVYRIIFIVGLFGWTTVARLVRGATLAARQRDYVRAARALGSPARRIMIAHILPNVLSPVIVATTLSVGHIILLESVLSFLGLGIQPPMPSWGNMLTNAQELIWSSPALAIYPGLLIFITVIAFNFLGDGLQDALDPRIILRKR